jgi:hypothetical protein
MNPQEIVNGLLREFWPRCVTCHSPATRRVSYVLVLGGERYCCDEHTSSERDAALGNRAQIDDLPSAELVREALKYVKLMES